jgi:hypothetical protein
MGNEWVIGLSRVSRTTMSAQQLYVQTAEEFRILNLTTGTSSAPFANSSYSFPVAVTPHSTLGITPLFHISRTAGASRLGLYLHDSLANSVRLLDAMGQQRQTFSPSEPRVASSRQILDVVLREYAASGRDTAALIRLPIPSTLPAASSFWANQDGWMAIERRDLQQRPWAEGDSVVVQFLDPLGRVVGDAVLPPGLMINDFRGSRLYGVRPDSSLVIPPAGRGGIRRICNRIVIISVDIGLR